MLHLSQRENGFAKSTKWLRRDLNQGLSDLQRRRYISACMNLCFQIIPHIEFCICMTAMTCRERAVKLSFKNGCLLSRTSLFQSLEIFWVQINNPNEENDLPSSWSVCTIGELCKATSVHTFAMVCWFAYDPRFTYDVSQASFINHGFFGPLTQEAHRATKAWCRSCSKTKQTLEMQAMVYFIICETTDCLLNKPWHGVMCEPTHYVYMHENKCTIEGRKDMIYHCLLTALSNCNISSVYVYIYGKLLRSSDV